MTPDNNEKLKVIAEPKILHLTLKKKWFDMILSGEKKEEYREIKNYWLERFDTRKFDIVRFTNGYSKTSPTMDVECLFINIDWGIPAWGAEIGKDYFVIGLGEILATKNIAAPTPSTPL